ncbi:MAG TPA: sugar phosphate isomerase/epimerase family protein [Spirochaetia bacterium]|nr:sugar phosphate isomerase/epimerase family protein [Spirochaetia bacterium]
MRIGLNSGIFPGAWSLSEKIAAAGRCGAGGIEINIEAAELLPRTLGRDDRRRLVGEARRAGVAVTSLCLNAHWVFALTDPDLRIREVASDLLLSAVELARELGAGTLLVPGCDKLESPPDRWMLFRDGLMRGIPRAEALGVTLAVEAVGRELLFDTGKILRLIEECGGSSALGIYLDTGNAFRGGLDPVVEIERAKGRAAMVHMKDWISDERRVTPLGEGEVGLGRAVKTLGSIGYDGWLNVELPPLAVDPEETARESVRYLKGLTETSL